MVAKTYSARAYNQQTKLVAEYVNKVERLEKSLALQKTRRNKLKIEIKDLENSNKMDSQYATLEAREVKDREIRKIKEEQQNLRQIDLKRYKEEINKTVQDCDSTIDDLRNINAKLTRENEQLKLILDPGNQMKGNFERIHEIALSKWSQMMSGGKAGA